ncbi:MAG: DUF262 domain-containing protein [Prevotellaceae bacterium]|nr:DUF262 domain-containing protein [Prevotellaceae bacterium]
MQKFSVNHLTIENLLSTIKSKEIAIPELQRPFVWNSNQIRDLLDSLYNGFPIGYLIIWRNPDMVDKNGEKTLGKKIMIDGQQRITALMTAVLGMPVLDKDFKEKTHRIAFNPFFAAKGEPCFEVQSAAIRKDKRWIADISQLFSSDFNAFDFVPEYCKDNPEMIDKELNRLIERVRDIRYTPIGVIELNNELSLTDVTEIFIRINSKGASLTQADFVMSTLAADELNGGNLLRKAIDYFCHLFSTQSFLGVVEKDAGFSSSKFHDMIKWVAGTGYNLFDLTFDDVLRIAFMSQYHRGKMASLTDLLHGRSFEQRTYEVDIMRDTFSTLEKGVEAVFSKYNYDQFSECLKSAGFVHPRLLRSRMSVDFAYMLSLRLRRDGTIDKLQVPHYVQRWYVMSVLTGRYSTSPETNMERDLRGIRDKGFPTYYNEVMANIGDTFWDVTIVQSLETSSSTAPAFSVFVAAQCKAVDASFLGVGSKVRDLLDTADLHHIFPKQYLIDSGINSSTAYNQVANYVYLSRPVNIAVGKKAPRVYLGEAVNSIEGGKESAYTPIKSKEELRRNLRENCIPEDVFSMDVTNYSDFLAKRRELMAHKIRDYFNNL